MKTPKTLQGIIDLLLGNLISIEIDVANDLKPLIKLIIPNNWVINPNEKYIIKHLSKPNDFSVIITVSVVNIETTLDELFLFVYSDIKKYNEELGDKMLKLKQKIDLIKSKEEEKINKLKQKYVGNIDIPILNEPITEELGIITNNTLINVEKNQQLDNSVIELVDDSISYKPFDDSMLDYPDERY